MSNLNSKDDQDKLNYRSKFQDAIEDVKNLDTTTFYNRHGYRNPTLIAADNAPRIILKKGISKIDQAL
ncbi:hypothetical protein [Rickettsiales endosymbiont of Stachyamoeba lipophora]|uniref:hypothetical protein n=1 Tax=Rickettsiales endosymbiont of Stachyamoeba lipophora TaxID=2486578 RepID=UPI000F6515DC|nr:hypothetical protein [Rickettsiales endosymbiont of Stachyamoeba lipophora]AZL16260.1 hypothetical protein EF513_06940 [Rickettsiales endosymbiont of Stachyamoeba lipophora]